MNPDLKDGGIYKYLDEYSDIGTHCIGLHIQNNDVTYFDSFWEEHIRKEIRTFIVNKNIKANIFRIQAYDSIMYGYFCIEFIDFMLARKTVTEFINLFFTKYLLKKWWYNSNLFYDKCLKDRR